MHDFTFLRDLIVILAAAVAVVSLLRRIGFPTVAGFILSGILLGPNALGLVKELENVQILAEVGVVLLLFGIGIELSLDRLRKLWKPILFGGAMQVGGTILVAYLILLAFVGSGREAIALGFLVACSSTAIVLRALHSRGEVEAPHGRLSLGILLFQDLAVVPILLFIPLLSGSTEAARWQTTLTMLKAALILGVVLVLARILVPRLLRAVAMTRQRDLFILTVLFVCLGTAWAASTVGLSLALGAFLGGLVVASSEYRHQALSDMMPVREVLTSIFFISIGMLLNPSDLLEGAFPITCWLAAIVFGKFAVVLLVALAMRMPLRVSIISAAALAHVGEFAFVISTAMEGTDLLVDPVRRNIMAAIVLSMFIAPLAIALGPRLAAGMTLSPRIQRMFGIRAAADAEEIVRGHEDHVIVVGYGVAGQVLAASLQDADIPYVVLELDAERVREAGERNEPVYFGDASSPEVLEHVGIQHAREVVLAINDPSAAVRAIAAARNLAPQVPILARHMHVADATLFFAAGATDVVFSEHEAAIEIARRVLLRHGIEPERVESDLATLRARWQAAIFESRQSSRIPVVHWWIVQLRVLLRQWRQRGESPKL